MTSEPPAQPTTALIIEDDIRRLLEMTLGQAGFVVESVPNGQEGLDRNREQTYTLITVDIGLPDMDGHDVVRALRTNYTGIVVIISARSSDADRDAGIAAGADLFLTKPFRPRELRAQFAELLAEHEVPHRGDR